MLSGLLLCGGEGGIELDLAQGSRIGHPGWPEKLGLKCAQPSSHVKLIGVDSVSMILFYP